MNEILRDDLSIDIPTIGISFLRPDQFPSVEMLFDSSRNVLEDLTDRYTLITVSNYELYYSCTIIEIPYIDIKNAEGYVRIFYDEYIERYSQEIVDKIVVKDENVIRNKIKDLINFAFNKVCNTSNKLKIVIPIYPNSTTSNIIYSAIHENFTIITTDISYKSIRMILSCQNTNIEKENIKDD